MFDRALALDLKNVMLHSNQGLAHFLASHAVSLPTKTGPHRPRFLAGYDTEEWDLILSDPALVPLSEMRRELRRLDRDVAGLH